MDSPGKNQGRALYHCSFHPPISIHAAIDVVNRQCQILCGVSRGIWQGDVVPACKFIGQYVGEDLDRGLQGHKKGNDENVWWKVSRGWAHFRLSRCVSRFWEVFMEERGIWTDPWKMGWISILKGWGKVQEPQGRPVCLKMWRLEKKM